MINRKLEEERMREYLKTDEGKKLMEKFLEMGEEARGVLLNINTQLEQEERENDKRNRARK